MGAQQSTSVPVAPPANVNSSDKAAGGISACPVAHEKKAVSPTSQAAECPVQHTPKKYQNPNAYNVYGQVIDPKNQMPATANQQPAPGQEVPLPVERESSSIPKGGTESTWSYPSPQMFWNSLVRKNKTEGVSEEDMESVVRIHNNMNESTWKQILEWEKLHPQPKDEGKEPTLLRFLGLPDQLSPKAQLKVILGHQPPFDRHDWVVDRGGKEVRYVIDYYHDEAHAADDKTPTSMKDLHSIRSIKLDVRPALDSFEALLDRTIRMPISQYLHQTTFKSLPLLPPRNTKRAEQQHRMLLDKYMMQIREQCEPQRLRLIACKTEKECEQAAIAMQHCTGGIVCPASAKEFELALKAEPVENDKLQKSFSSMIKCLELFESDLKASNSRK